MSKVSQVKITDVVSENYEFGFIQSQTEVASYVESTMTEINESGYMEESTVVPFEMEVTKIYQSGFIQSNIEAVTDFHVESTMTERINSEEESAYSQSGFIEKSTFVTSESEMEVIYDSGFTQSQTELLFDVETEEFTESGYGVFWSSLKDSGVQTTTTTVLSNWEDSLVVTAGQHTEIITTKVSNAIYFIIIIYHYYFSEYNPDAPI